MPPLQVGLMIPPGPDWMAGTSRDTFVADVRRVLDRIEGTFDSAWMPDHFHLVRTSGTFECWSTLSFFAALYPRLRFGSMVTAYSFRNPALLAKIAATLQFLTEGRVILGIGTGWNEQEHRAFGYDFPRPGTRVEQLDEALQVITSLWREPSATFTGRHYRVTDARCDPRPGTSPALMIGGKKPRMLQLAARYADWWNADWTGGTEYHDLVARLNNACREVGRDPLTIKKTWLGLCSCATTTDAALDALNGGWAEGQPNRGLVGTPAQIAAGLAPYVEAGLDHWMMFTPALPDPTTLELLVGELVPQLRAKYGGQK